MVLIGGDPGIGKSTLLIQAAAKLAQSGERAVYISGEEAVAQVRLRAERPTATVPAAYWACGLPQSLDSAALLQHAAAR